MGEGRPGAGYFGKLPDRADFVVSACPPGFLKLWELFVTKGLIQSREDLGDAWEEAYMTMPVWRFRLTPVETGGALADPVVGALMPSVDKVGRKFPLTVVAAANSGVAPDGRGAEGWFAEAESALLSVLAEDSGLADFQDAVAGLGAPCINEIELPPGDMRELAADAEADPAVLTEFWCEGGPRRYAFRCRGVPRAEAFRWLLLPETFGSEESRTNVAGSTEGRLDPENDRI